MNWCSFDVLIGFIGLILIHNYTDMLFSSISILYATTLFGFNNC